MFIFADAGQPTIALFILLAGLSCLFRGTEKKYDFAGLMAQLAGKRPQSHKKYLQPAASLDCPAKIVTR